MVHRKIIWISLLVFVTLFITWFLVYRFLFPFMWNYLVVDETLEPSDVIIVLSGDQGRVEYGIELFHQGYADYILFSGGSAGFMKRHALSNGVSEDHILIDSGSNNTYGNASNSADITQTHNLRSTIVVTSAYHTKRAGLIFAQYFPRDNLTICAVPYGSSANHWWKDMHLSKMVILEYLKLVHHYLFK